MPTAAIGTLVGLDLVCGQMRQPEHVQNPIGFDP